MFRERGYDVVVACNFAKVDVRIRFSLPAPLLENSYIFIRMETNKKLNDLKNKLSQLQDELETKDNNPIESNRIRREISILIKDIKREELNQPVSVERGKELFANMRRELGLDETISYRQFFDL